MAWFQNNKGEILQTATISIKTPKGNAKGTISKLKYVGIVPGKNDVITISKADDEIIWKAQRNPSDMKKMFRNIAAYDYFVKTILGSKMVQKAARLSKEDTEKLKELLQDETRISIVEDEKGV